MSAIPSSAVADSSWCSTVSRALGEEAFATAPFARAWVLIEHPGAWRKDPFAGGFEPAVAAELAARAEASEVRILAIRSGIETDSDRWDGRGRQVFVAHCGFRRPWLAGRRVRQESDLLQLLDLSRLAAGEVPATFERETAALYLVCTHAGRDACCGRNGRPVAAALRAARPGRVWECSHPGGHRFAANLLCLPEGLLYGRVTPGDAPELAQLHEAGWLEPRLLRGRSCLAPELQASDHFLRAALGERRIDHPTPPGQAGADPIFATGSRRWRVKVRSVPAGPRSISCGTEEAEDPGTYELESIEEATP